MKFRNKYFFSTTLIILVMLVVQAKAQEKFVQNHGSLWLSAKLKYNFTHSKLFSVTDLGYRFIDKRNTTLIRTGVGVNINSKLNFISGIAYFHVQPSANEFRFFHYINYTTNPDKVFLNTRLRLEERWINGKFLFRNGLLAGINYVFADRSKQYKLSLYDEYLYHINNQNKFSSFDQNRCVISLEKKLNKNNRISIAAMYQSTPVLIDRYVIQLIWNSEL